MKPGKIKSFCGGGRGKQGSWEVEKMRKQVMSEATSNEKFLREGPGPRGAGGLRRSFGPSGESLNCNSQTSSSSTSSSSFIIHNSSLHDTPLAAGGKEQHVRIRYR